MKRILVRVTGLALVGFSGLSFADGCSIEQRIELAKVGYEKAEIEALCAASVAASVTLTPDQVLAAAIYEPIETARLDGAYWEREKCEFLGDSVKVNNNKKTFGGYYSKVIPYDKFSTYPTSRQLTADRERGHVSATLAITAFGVGAANETCYAVLIARNNIAAEDFDAQVQWAEGELDAVTQALNAKGAHID